MEIPFWAPALLAAIVVTILEWRRQRKHARPPSAAPPAERQVVEIRADPDSPIGFGRKNRWIAVRAASAGDLAGTLGLAESAQANWKSGFVAAYAWPSDYVFVTPPIDGWVLAVGSGLPDPGDPGELPRWRSLMTEISRRHGEAQFFATHRVSSYTAWAQYVDGAEERLFAHADDPIHDLGEPLPEEIEIREHLPAAAAAEPEPDGEVLWSPDEEDVLRLAAAWSVDPSELESRDLPPSVGVVGRLLPPGESAAAGIE